MLTTVSLSTQLNPHGVLSLPDRRGLLVSCLNTNSVYHVLTLERPNPSVKLEVKVLGSELSWRALCHPCGLALQPVALAKPMDARKEQAVAPGPQPVVFIADSQNHLIQKLAFDEKRMFRASAFLALALLTLAVCLRSDRLQRLSSSRLECEGRRPGTQTQRPKTRRLPV